jgi:hypothetical protein
VPSPIEPSGSPWRWLSLAVTFASAIAGILAFAVRGTGGEIDPTTLATLLPASRTSFSDPAPFGRGPTVDPDAPFPHERSRRVLALYDSSEMVENPDAPAGAPKELPMSTETALAHRLAELPLNHLGLGVDY